MSVIRVLKVLWFYLVILTNTSTVSLLLSESLVPTLSSFVSYCHSFSYSVRLTDIYDSFVSSALWSVTLQGKATLLQYFIHVPNLPNDLLGLVEVMEYSGGSKGLERSGGNRRTDDFNPFEEILDRRICLH